MWCRSLSSSTSKLELFHWIVKIHEFLKCARSVEGHATGRFIRSCVSLSSEQFKAVLDNVEIMMLGNVEIMYNVVLDNVEITNPKT